MEIFLRRVVKVLNDLNDFKEIYLYLWNTKTQNTKK